jgi:multiple sugar transport system permease protein
LYTLSITLGVIFFFPYFYTVMRVPSSRRGRCTNLAADAPPLSIAWENYIRTVTMVPFGLWVYNTIVITTLATVGGVLTSSVAAFSFARFRYRFRELLFMITLGQ